MLFYGTGPLPPPRNAQQRAHSLRQPIPPTREKNTTGVDISQTNLETVIPTIWQSHIESSV